MQDTSLVVAAPVAATAVSGEPELVAGLGISFQVSGRRYLGPMDAYQGSTGSEIRIPERGRGSSAGWTSRKT
jgi:hypothetical protein